MIKIDKQEYSGERALFTLHDAYISNTRFFDGESPLKEGSDLELYNCTFEWKYPLWYTTNVKVDKSLLKETARSGIWYVNNIQITNTLIEAPKTFRRCKGIRLENVDIPNAQETIWKCDDIKLKNVTAKGDYFGFNSSNIVVSKLKLDGNYAFDGGENIEVVDSILNSKDSFWNCKNVVVKNSIINGEYLGWNTINLTLINCTIISHQGLCYIKGLKMIDCIIKDSDLTFEYCEDVDATILSEVDSIKNPYSGVIRCKGVKELILDEKYIDKSKVKIEIIK